MGPPSDCGSRGTAVAPTPVPFLNGCTSSRPSARPCPLSSLTGRAKSRPASLTPQGGGRPREKGEETGPWRPGGSAENRRASGGPPRPWSLVEAAHPPSTLAATNLWSFGFVNVAFRPNQILEGLDRNRLPTPPSAFRGLLAQPPLCTRGCAPLPLLRQSA